MITATETRTRARKSLKGRWGRAVLITLCYVVFEWLVSLILNLSEDNSGISLLLSIANIVISVPIAYGILNSFMKLKRGEEVGAFEFLSSGFSNFSRSWKVAFSILRKLIIPIILIIVVFVLIAIGVGVAVFETATDINTTVASSTSSSGSALLTIAGMLLIVAEIWAFVKGLYYVLSNFIAIDNPEMDSKQAVEESERLMTNNRGNYFVLTLSFIGWAILACFTLGIGFLWLVPYIQVAQICFYEYLAGRDKSEIEAEVIEEKTEE